MEHYERQFSEINTDWRYRTVASRRYQPPDFELNRRYERNRNYRPTGRENYFRERRGPDSVWDYDTHGEDGDHFGRNGGSYNSSSHWQQNYDPGFEPNRNMEMAPDYEEVVTTSGGYKTNEEPVEVRVTVPKKPTPVKQEDRPSPDLTTAKKEAVPRKPAWDVFSEKAADNGTSHSESQTHAWKKIFITFRIVFALLFFLFILGTATVTRLTLLVMTYNIRVQPRQFVVNGSAAGAVVLKEGSGTLDVKWVWALMIVMATPYVFTSVGCLWKIIFKKTKPLQCLPLLAALLVETLHSLGLCILVFYVIPSFDPIIGSFLMLNVAFIPGLIQVFHWKPKPPEPVLQETSTSSQTPNDPSHGENPKQSEAQYSEVVAGNYSLAAWRCRKATDLLMLLLHLGSMLVWMCIAYTVIKSTLLTILIPVSLVLTSLSWWENYVSGKKKKSVTKSTTNPPSSANADKLPDLMNNAEVKPAESKTETKLKLRTNFLTKLKRAIKKRRTKITFLTSLWKLLLTIGLPALGFSYNSHDCFDAFFKFYKRQAQFPANFTADFPTCSILQPKLQLVHEVTDCHPYYPFNLAAINVACSILCYKVGKSCCKTMLQIPSFVMPLLIATPLTLVCLGASYMDSADFQSVFGGCNLSWVKLGSTVHIGDFLLDFTVQYWVPAGIAVYISYLFITGHVWNPKAERMSRTDKLFSKPLYCGILMDQSLLLNRRRDEDDPTDHKLAGQWLSEVEDIRELELKEACSRLRTDTTPLIYICATMWHETETEMIMMLKSVFRLDFDQSARKNAQLYFGIRDPDYYEFEAHVFFDDAYDEHADDDFDYSVNNFVKQLVRVIDTAASSVHGTEVHIPKPRKIPTPYGGRLVWDLPGGNTFTVHLKDKAKIRHRKRWSQVMYMYYFLGYQLIGSHMSIQRKKLRADNTFLLALDGDVDFQPQAVQILVDRMKQNPQLGAACGRIHPIGSGPMVWYQKFEYAVSHWLQKSTEHILGCVLCSPGCFSLFRGSALMDDNVMKRYTTPPTEPRHYVQYDQGEDRWLCTLLLQQGYRVEYCAASDSFTFAPEGFYEFYNQRRRWTPSTMANIIDLLGDWKSTTKKNQDISLLYIIYQFSLLASGIVTPGTIFLLIVGSISTATQDSIPLWGGMVINAIPIVIFVILCFKADTSTQLAFASVLSLVYTVVMMLVLVGLIRQAAENGWCSVSTTFLIGVISIFVITALMHPMEFTSLFHGFLYFLSIPSMSMLLMIYSLGNLHVVSWGTREVKSAAPPPPNNEAQPIAKKTQNSNFLKDALTRLADTHNATSDYAFSFGNLFRCLCCPKEESNTTNLKFEAIVHSLKELDSKISDMSAAPGNSSKSINNLPQYLSQGEMSSTSDEVFDSTADGQASNVPAKVDKVEPRNELRNPKWADDKDLGKGPKEFIIDEEAEFWKKFIGQYLYPLDKDEKHEKNVRAQLLELRNSVCLAFLLINTLFIILISALQIISERTTNLSVKIPCNVKETTFTGEKIEPISVTFTMVFGVMLSMQFIAMFFHRYSTLLHIISITKIQFRRLTRQMFGMKMDEKEVPTVEETIDLVRDMQVLREPEEDYEEIQPDYDTDTPAGTLGHRRTGGDLWDALHARSRRTKGDQTLSKAFLKNFEKLAKKMQNESVTEGTNEQRAVEAKQTFRNLERRSQSTIIKLAKDDKSKEHIIKRSNEAKIRWKRGLAKIIGPKARFRNLVEESTTRNKQQEENVISSGQDPARSTRVAVRPSAASSISPYDARSATAVQIETSSDAISGSKWRRLGPHTADRQQIGGNQNRNNQQSYGNLGSIPDTPPDYDEALPDYDDDRHRYHDFSRGSAYSQSRG